MEDGGDFRKFVEVKITLVLLTHKLQERIFLTKEEFVEVADIIFKEFV